jgi:Flp pilus assembly protein TadG
MMRRTAPHVEASAQRGQASVELLAALPVLIALGLAGIQLLAVGYASVLAGNAAEAGALALAGASNARDARAGVREALPGWSHAQTRVSVEGGRVTVRLRPPALMSALEERLEVTADAAVEAP